MKLTKPRPTDPWTIGRALRRWDREECAMHGVHGAEHLGDILLLSTITGDPVWTIAEDDGTPIGMTGISSIPGRPVKTGLAWLLGTTGLDRDPKGFVALGQEAFGPERIGSFQRLENVIPTARVSSRRWLARLGFQFLTPVRHKSGVLVTPFYWEREQGLNSAL